MNEENNVQQPEPWEICKNKSHWMDRLIFGGCEECGETVEVKFKRHLPLRFATWTQAEDHFRSNFKVSKGEFNDAFTLWAENEKIEVVEAEQMEEADYWDRNSHQTKYLKSTIKDN